MKQKYTLSIADMEINVVTDQSPESVEYIVGILDRKMREIGLKSKRCTKNEAAVLCALDFCADKIMLKEEKEELEEQLEELADKLEHLEEKYELVKSNAERLEKERARLEVENSKLREKFDSVRFGVPVDTEAEEKETAAEAAALAEPETVPEKKEEPASYVKKKPVNKSRVGSMFDLLTFTDI